ncbi:hypothetical protein BRETT_002637 [Brettanomyces bruxellensis]|uniref:Uncharacterized protein n=1 Tax=Dekkera bruxellensis TaxID=5007 RepID=A0A871R6V4_DEKBR|nr:uncharacterized protein BRETT_002637 [Brettanomyces bruxellensis]QOU22457.1 hypothetical protein BRETT_002637 [Brettanomyces bruxellensis]
MTYSSPSDKQNLESLADTYKKLNEGEAAASKLEKILDQIEGNINEMVQDIEEASKKNIKEDSSKDKQAGSN